MNYVAIILVIALQGNSLIFGIGWGGGDIMINMRCIEMLLEEKCRLVQYMNCETMKIVGLTKEDARNQNAYAYARNQNTWRMRWC